MSIRCILAAIVLGAITATAAAQPAQVVAYDHRALYEALTPSIAEIMTDAGRGSGFLISEEGFIATSYQVVRNSHYVSAEFIDRGRFAVDVVLLEPRYDLAVLKVNSAVIRGLEPLTLLPEINADSVIPGIPVVAFGSPLSPSFLIAQGVISTMTENLLRGDFLILPGNSGGPLVNLNGEVVGISTTGGQGAGEAVPVAALRRVFDVRFARYDGQEPPAEPLPRLSADSYPTKALKAKIEGPAVDDGAYELQAGRFTIQAITPVRLGRLHIREAVLQARDRMNNRDGDANGEHPGGPSALFAEWVRRADDWLDYAVTFEIKPEFDGAAGSTWATMASALAPGFGFGVSGTPRPLVLPHRELELGAEFEDFRIYRDGELVDPIRPGRSITDIAFQPYDMTLVDAAYSGLYVYAPDAFMTGDRFRLEVYGSGEPGGLHRRIDLESSSALIQQLRLDFEGTGTSPRHSRTEKEEGTVTVSLPISSLRRIEREEDPGSPLTPDTAEVDTEETTWHVQHVHRFFGGSHPGTLTLTATGLQFVADNGQHSFVAEWRQITEVTPWLTLGPSAVGIELDSGASSQFRMDSRSMLDNLLVRAEQRIAQSR